LLFIFAFLALSFGYLSGLTDKAMSSLALRSGYQDRLGGKADFLQARLP